MEIVPKGMQLFPDGVKQKIGRGALVLDKHSPRIMFVAGIAGTIASTVMACRATLKLSDKLDEFKHDIEQVEGLKTTISENGSYKQKDYNKDLAYVYAKGSYSIAKLYAPSVIVGGLSIAALTGSHLTLSKRNSALTAAYSALKLSYDSYRDRVKKEVGEEKERDIYHAIETREVTFDGKTKKIKSADPNKWSPYARFFDESSPNWQKSPELNRLFVQCQQNYANHLLHARGHVFLNEVYDMLGIERSQAGQVVGWVVGDEGDNYIDFGVFEAHNSAFVNGWERSILLDFNVDGVIYDKI